MVLIQHHASKFAFQLCLPTHCSIPFCWKACLQNATNALRNRGLRCDVDCDGCSNHGAAAGISAKYSTGSTTNYAKSGATSVFHLCHQSSSESAGEEFGLRPIRNRNVSHTRSRKQSLARYLYFHSISGDTQTGFACGRL